MVSITQFQMIKNIYILENTINIMDLLNLLETLASDRSFHDRQMEEGGFGQYELIIQAAERRHGKTETWDKMEEIINNNIDDYNIINRLLNCANWRRDPDTDKQRFQIIMNVLENPKFSDHNRVTAMHAIAIFEDDSEEDFEGQVSIIRQLYGKVDEGLLKSCMAFILLLHDRPRQTMGSESQLVFRVLCHLNKKSDLKAKREQIMISIKRYGKTLTIDALKFAINHSALSSFGREFGKTMLEVMAQ